MIALQLLYFLLAAIIMAGVGGLIMLPPLRHKQYDKIYPRMLIGFAAKLVLGAGLLLLSWKGLGWSTTVSAFGMVSAYLVALMTVTLTAMLMMKRGEG